MPFIGGGKPNRAHMYGLVADQQPRPVRIDAATHAQTVIDYEHHEVHGGSHYFAYISVLLANTEELTIGITTPNTTKWGHFIWKLNSSDIATFDVLHTVTSFAGGTSFTARNSNMNSTNTSGMIIIASSDAGADTAIVPTGGTEYYMETIKSGNKIGGASRGDSEKILKQNNNLLFRMASGANGNVCSLVLDWYEHTNKD